MYWHEYKVKRENKNTTNVYRYFLKSNFVGVNRLFVLIYWNQDDNAKRYKAWRYHLPKGQPVDSIIKRYQERRKLRSLQDEEYTTWF